MKVNNGFELGTSNSRSSVSGVPIYPATVTDLGTQTAAASLTMSCNAGSIFTVTVSGLSNGTITLTPIGGYKGQVVTVIATNSATVVSLAFQSSSSVTIEATAASTSLAIGSTGSITLVNVGPGLVTPTTSNVLMQVATALTYYAAY